MSSIVLLLRRLEVGGDEVLAVDLAVELQRRGHHVDLVADDGPLVGYARDRGLSPRVVRGLTPGRRRLTWSLTKLVATRRPAVIHLFGWRASWQVASLVAAAARTPITSSIHTRAVSPAGIPPDMHLVVGRRHIHESVLGRQGVSHLLAAPVDTRFNTPGSAAEASSDIALLVDAFDVVVTVACRLRSNYFEMVRQVIEAVAARPASERVGLLLVGEGDARGDIEAVVDAVENRVGRRVVVLAGELTDPRPAYRAADLVLGSGTSVLRGMACGAAGMTVDSEGDATILGPESLDHLLTEGPFTSLDPDLRMTLDDALDEMVTRPARRAEAAAFGRDYVRAHRSLEGYVDHLESVVYPSARPPSRRDIVSVVRQVMGRDAGSPEGNVDIAGSTW